MLHKAFTLLCLYFTWSNCDILNTRDVLNLHLITRIEITDFDGPMNRDTFGLFKHLFELEVRNSNITLSTDFLQALPRLRKLTMVDNHITKIDSNTTGCCYYIKHLYLENNNIENLKIEDIGHIPHIFTLVLHKEIVPILRTNVFSGSPRIMEMNITYSGLETIEIGAFNGLDELTFLNLEGNKLRSISWQVIGHLRILETLMLGSNHLREFTSLNVKDMDWLKFIDISYNPITNLKVADVRDYTLRVKQINVTGIKGVKQDILTFGH